MLNKYLKIHFDQHMTLPDAEKRQFGNKYDPKELFIEGHDYIVWSENQEESTDKEELIVEEESINKEEFNDVSPMQPLKVDEEEVREG